MHTINAQLRHGTSGMLGKKSFFFLMPNIGSLFTGKFSTNFSSFSFSLCLKWFLNKSTLWWAASVQHTSSVKYCLITNEAHMFSTGFSWSKLYCYLHLNFLRVLLFQGSILNQKRMQQIIYTTFQWPESVITTKNLKDVPLIFNLVMDSLTRWQ